MSKSSHRGFWLCCLSAASAAVFLTCFKLAARQGEVADMVFWLLGGAAVFNTLSTGVALGGSWRWRLDRVTLATAAALALFTLVGNYCAAAAVSRISPPLTSVFQQTQVLFVALLGFSFLGESITRRFVLGSLLALVGLWIMRSPGVVDPDQRISGIAFATGSALAFACMAVVTRKYIRKIEPIEVNAIRLWFSLLGWLLIEQRAPTTSHPTTFYLYCLLGAFAGPFLARAGLMYALKYLPASQVALFGLMTPPMAIIPSFIVFGELPTPQEIIGSGILLLGVAVPTLRWASAQRWTPR